MRTHDHRVAFTGSQPANDVRSLRAFHFLLEQRVSIASGCAKQFFQPGRARRVGFRNILHSLQDQGLFGGSKLDLLRQASPAQEKDDGSTKRTRAAHGQAILHGGQGCFEIGDAPQSRGDGKAAYGFIFTV